MYPVKTETSKDFRQMKSGNIGAFQFRLLLSMTKLYLTIRHVHLTLRKYVLFMKNSKLFMLYGFEELASSEDEKSCVKCNSLSLSCYFCSQQFCALPRVLAFERLVSFLLLFYDWYEINSFVSFEGFVFSFSCKNKTFAQHERKKLSLFWCKWNLLSPKCLLKQFLTVETLNVQK